MTNKISPSQLEEKVFHLLTKEYTLSLATTKKELDDAKDVRAEAYSQRYGLSKEELDAVIHEYDEQSYIYLLRHNASGKAVGTLRLIFVNEDTPSKTIPMVKDFGINDIDHLAQALPVCEVSRLALIKDIPLHEEFSANQLRAYLSVALMAATRINVFLNDYKNVFALMEPTLHRILKRQGVHFEQAGEAVNFHGQRVPYIIPRYSYAEAVEKTEGAMGKLTQHYLFALANNSAQFWSFIDAHPCLKRENIQLDRIARAFSEHGYNVAWEHLLDAIDTDTDTVA